MVNITAIATAGTQTFFAGDKGAEIASEPQVDGSGTIILDRATSKMAIERFAHVFAAVKFYSDTAGTVQVAEAATSTITITIQTTSGGGVAAYGWESPANNVISGLAPHTVDWAANTLAVRAVASSIGAASWRLVVSANRT